MKDPTSSAARWAQNLQGATEKIREGVQAVQVAPGAAAARQRSVWLQNLTASADKWTRNVGAVPLSEWQSDMINKGIPRIGTGAQGAQQKFAAFLTSFLPFVDAGVRALPPRGNLQQNIARMVAMVQHNAQYTGRPAGR